METLSRIGFDLLHFIAPNLCPACDGVIRAGEGYYCGGCRDSMEPAPYPREIYSEIAGNFPGDAMALSAVGSLYTFAPDGPVQRLVHAVKYEGCYRLGIQLGVDLARAIRMFPELSEFDCVVPVPLHPARRRERGYNQAEAIGRGIVSGGGNVKLVEALRRRHHTRSQTRLGAVARELNVRDAFSLDPSRINGATVLLCDDVCTTGSTLNACADILLSGGAARVVAATVAKDLAS